MTRSGYPWLGPYRPPLGGHIYGVDLSEGMLRALFSSSYEVIPEYRKALRNAWSQLRLSGHLVILGQRTPQGMLGRWLRPIGVTVSRATVLGDPDRSAWEDLRELTVRIDLEEPRDQE